MKGLKIRSILVAAAVALAVAPTGRADFILTDSQHLDVNSSHSLGVLYDSSTAEVGNGGSISKAYVNDKALLWLRRGSVYSLNAHDTSSVEMSDGTVTNLYAHGTSSVHMSGGRVSLSFYAYDTSSVGIYGGSVQPSLYAYDTSSVDMSAGSVSSFVAHDTSSVVMSGGSAGGLTAYDTSSIDMTGGSVSSLVASDTSSVDMSGGSASSLYTSGTSSVDLSGGSVANLYARDTTSVTFHGHDFRIAAGGLRLDGERVLGTGVLTGKWFDETPWGVTIQDNQPRAAIWAVVPEPSTLLLLGMGAMGLLAYARGNRKTRFHSREDKSRV